MEGEVIHRQCGATAQVGCTQLPLQYTSLIYWLCVCVRVPIGAVCLCPRLPGPSQAASVLPAQYVLQYVAWRGAGGKHGSIRRCIRALHALPSKNERLFGGSAIDARATRRRGLSSIINVGPARPPAGQLLLPCMLLLVVYRVSL